MHAVQIPDVFKPIPVGTSFTGEELHLWPELQEQRKKSDSVLDSWVMGLSTGDMLRLNRLTCLEQRHGTAALDHMISAMNAEV